MDDCTSTYWRGLIHGLLLMLPVAGFLYRKWTQAAARASLMKPDDKQPTLGCVFFIAPRVLIHGCGTVGSDLLTVYCVTCAIPVGLLPDDMMCSMSLRRT